MVPTLIIPKEFEKSCDAFNFYNIWLVDALSPNALALRNQQQESNDDNNTSSTTTKQTIKSKLSTLTYQTIFRILEFAASSIPFKVQHTWGYGGGSSWGGPPDVVFVETCRIDPRSRGGLAVRLQVKIGKEWVQNAKLSLDVKAADSLASLRTLLPSATLCGGSELSWSDEPAPSREGKPTNGSLQFASDDARHGNAIVMHGWVQFPREGRIECYGRMRTWDRRNGAETTGGPLKHIRE